MRERFGFVLVTVFAVALTVGLFAGTADAAEKTYLLSGRNWGAGHNKAIRDAGGDVLWSHKKTGMGAVVSSNPTFLDDVTASRKFNDALEDVEIEWQQPIFGGEVGDPGDETYYGIQWNMWSVEAEGAWDAGCDGSGARVAILDGGIYDAHADLSSNIDRSCSISFEPNEPWNSDTGTFWHGTHVAGIVAATDNGFGVIGIAPRATLMGVKVLHDGSGPFTQILAGILFASDPGSFPGYEDCEKADIINMSLGSLFRKKDYPGFIGYVTKAVNFAASKGVLVVASAGNEGFDLGQASNFTHIPSDAGTALSISATGPVGFAYGGDDYRRPASYSNYGEGHVFLAGPGGDYVFPGDYWWYDMVISTIRGSSTPPYYSFGWAAGTSMAAPMVSGVAALIKGANPNISLGALKAKLKKTADDEGKKGHDEFYGHGFVNARRACTE